MLTLDQSIFFLGFFSVFFLLIPFGETPFGILLMGMITGLLWCFRSQLQFKNISVVKWPLSFLFVATCFTFFSSFTTLSIPLTLNNAFFYAFATLCFLFFLFVDEKWLNVQVFILGLVATGLALSCFVVLLFFLPQLGRYLPATNLLIASYGHNHASIFLLFVLPLSFWVWVQNRSKKISLLPVIGITAVLCLSFGREAILLSILDFVLFFLVVPPSLKRKVSLIVSPVVLFSLVLIGLGALLRSSQANQCFLPIFQAQVCKPFTTDTRFAYWKVALKAFAIQPLFGWGGGTYVILATLLADNVYDFSAYVHNGYLQLLAEYGLVACIFFFGFFISAFTTVIKQLKKLQPTLAFFFGLSILSLLIDGFFDYNWNYLVIWCSLLIACAFILKLSSHATKKQEQSSFLSRRLLPWSFSFISLLMVVWTGLYVSSSLAWATGKYTLSQELFPFVYWRVEELVGTTKVSSAENQELLQLYNNHTAIWLSYLGRTHDPQTRLSILNHLLALNRLNSQLRFQLFYELYQSQEWAPFIEQMKIINKLYSGVNSWKLPSYFRQLYFNCATQAANQLLKTDPQTALTILVQQYDFDHYKTNSLPINLLSQPSQYDSQLLEEFLAQVTDRNDVWAYTHQVTPVLVKAAANALNKGDQSSFEVYYQRVLWFAPWPNDHSIWGAVSVSLSSRFQKAMNMKDLHQAQSELDNWLAIWHDLQSRNSTYIDSHFSNQLAEAYLQLGDAFFAQDLHQAINNYAKAAEVNKDLELSHQLPPTTRQHLLDYLTLSHTIE